MGDTIVCFRTLFGWAVTNRSNLEGEHIAPSRTMEFPSEQFDSCTDLADFIREVFQPDYEVICL